MNLAEFLLARIAEDEAVARHTDRMVHMHEGVGGYDQLEPGADGGRWAAYVVVPTARVLAECEAKRQIIEAAWSDHLLIENEWGHCRGRESLTAANDYPEAVRLLALPYNTHPDYREEWKQ